MRVDDIPLGHLELRLRVGAGQPAHALGEEGAEHVPVGAPEFDYAREGDIALEHGKTKLGHGSILGYVGKRCVGAGVWKCGSVCLRFCACVNSQSRQDAFKGKLLQPESAKTKRGNSVKQDPGAKRKKSTAGQPKSHIPRQPSPPLPASSPPPLDDELPLCLLRASPTDSYVKRGNPMTRDPCPVRGRNLTPCARSCASADTSLVLRSCEGGWPLMGRVFPL